MDGSGDTFTAETGPAETPAPEQGQPPPPPGEVDAEPYRRVHLPSVSLTAPTGWLTEESITLQAEANGDGYVSATVRDLPEGSADLAAYAQQEGDDFEANLRGYEHIGLEAMSIRGAREALLREFRWTTNEDVVIHQYTVYADMGARLCVATATAQEGRFAELRDSLLAVLDSITVRADA